jgi:hypothetical protein
MTYLNDDYLQVIYRTNKCTTVASFKPSEIDQYMHNNSESNCVGKKWECLEIFLSIFQDEYQIKH